MMRTLLGCVVLALCGTLAADDKKEEKIDPAKLVGKWEAKDQKGSFTEYTKDGKVLMTVTGDDGVTKKVLEGTYSLDKNKLTLKTSLNGGPARETTQTVTKLNDTELVTTRDKGKKRTYDRVKDK